MAFVILSELAMHYGY